MKKHELISKLAEKTGQSKVLCETILDAFGDVLLEALLNKESVPLGKVCQIKYKLSAARICRMINTGEKKEVPAKGGASLTLSKSTKQSLSKVI